MKDELITIIEEFMDNFITVHEIQNEEHMSAQARYAELRELRDSVIDDIINLIGDGDYSNNR